MSEGRESKSELLNQLRIAKTGGKPEGISLQAAFGIASFSLVVGALLGYLIFGGESEVPHTQKLASPSEVAAHSEPDDNLAEPAESIIAPAGPAPILNASGYITARLVATVSSEVLGLITSVDVEEGMAVEANQVLARLDDTAARVNLEFAQAQVTAQQARQQSIQVELDETQRVLKRIINLQNIEFSSEAELTRAQADFDKSLSALATTKADIEVAKLEVARQQEKLDNYTIRAPFAGIVTVKNAQPGEIVSPSSAGGGFTRTGICTIVDMNSLEIEVDVNEAFIGRVYPEQKVVAKLDAYPQWAIPASVIAIIPTADRAKATVRVRIKIETEDQRILPDMGVKVAFMK